MPDSEPRAASDHFSIVQMLRTAVDITPDVYFTLDGSDPRFLSGHIHPISPYYLCFGALRAGLRDVRLFTDRSKRSAVAWLPLLGPLVLLGRWAQPLQPLR